ncbi:MAG: D-aminoacylase [Acidobacteriota bacterium]
MRLPLSALLVLLLTAFGCASRPAPFDLLLVGGQIVDGAGGDPKLADVGIRGERIAAIGDLEGSAARRQIDVGGLVVTPGFIDTHSHAAEGLISSDRSDARALLLQGVTTVFVNPDGGGPVDLAEQREALQEHGLGVNVAQFIGHGSVRREILGMAGRAPTALELDAMRDLVRRAMGEGAFGLSSGPFYTPGSYAETAELIALARVAAEGGGAYASHIRDESSYTIGLLAAVQEVLDVAEAADLPSVVTHIKALGPPVWGKSRDVVALIDEARARGLEVFADQYPYLASATGLRAALVPRWAQEGGRSAFLERLDEPKERQRILEAMAANLRRRGGAERIQFRRFAPEPSVEGQTLAKVAELRSMDPLECALALILQGPVGIVSFNMQADDVERFMKQPWTMTASDGSYPPWGEGVPHPRSFGTFPRRLALYARDRQVLDTAQTVRSMTRLPALVYGLEERGRLEVGALADVAIFDLAQLRDRATFTEPYQLAEGMRFVLVGGELAVESGQPSGALAGRVLSLRRSRSTTRRHSLSEKQNNPEKGSAEATLRSRSAAPRSGQRAIGSPDGR